MLLAVALTCLLVAIGARGGSGVPGRLQAMAEMSYEFIAGMVRSAAGETGMRFFPFVFCDLLFCSPGKLDRLHTLHIQCDEPDRHHRRPGADGVFSGRVIGIKDHGLHFFKLFVPPGVPIYILPLVVAIEIVSFFVAPCQSFGAFVRQHACRPHHDQRVRRASSLCCWAPARRSRRSRCCRSS